MTASFERQVLPLRRSLYGHAMRLTRDPAEAEDLLQDTMVRAFRFWDTFKQDTNVKAWLFVIMRNTHFNNYTRERRRAETDRALAFAKAREGEGLIVLDGVSRAEAERDVDAARLVELVALEVERLPDSYRAAVTLCDIEGYSYKEIADILGCPIGTVMSRIYRGRRALYNQLHEAAAGCGYVSAPRKPERPSTRKPARP